MATEEGIVIKITPNTAVIRATRKSACESCSQKHACAATENSQEMEFEADNSIQAKVGDKVTISLPTGKLLSASFLLYIFPIIMMIAGALTGDLLANAYQMDRSIMSAGGGFLFFFIAFGIVKIKDMQAKKSGGFLPKIIRIHKNISL